jgi:hypothetical protein
MSDIIYILQYLSITYTETDYECILVGSSVLFWECGFIREYYNEIRLLGNMHRIFNNYLL